MPTASQSSGKWRFPFFPTVIALAYALVFTGCSGGGGSGPTNIVKGKVTLGGQPVSGEVVFISADKKELKTLTALNGDYAIPNPAKGEYTVIVKSNSSVGSTAAPSGDKGKGALPNPGASGPAQGVEPPAKFGKPETSGLKFTVTGGEQTYEIKLD